jgi:cyclic nucleotide-binding protein/tetratricopeptide repeat protein
VALGFGKGKEEDVVSLIAAKKYARAIEVLKAQLQKKGANPSLRMQLADVLILADKKQEAVSLLIPLADQFAREGFAAKAVSVLKKIQKVDPGRREVEERLARQIEEKQREATGLPLARPGGPARDDASGFADGPSLEIGMEPIAPMSAPAGPIELPPAAAAAPPDTTLPVASSPLPAAAPLPTLELSEEPPLQRAPMPPRAPAAPAEIPLIEVEPTAFVLAEPAVVPAPAPAPTPAQPVGSKPPDEEIEDYDLLYFADDGDDDETIEVPVEAELVEGAVKAEPMSAGEFADELMGLVDSVFQEFKAAPTAAPSPSSAAAAASTHDEPHGGNQIVVSPLFRDFSVDEMVAVIQGLKLLSYERGAVILREGQGGGSLYMLTSGRVRAFKKSADGKQNTLGDLKEGAFFGEMSILTGQPRMASVVALARCELLELDRPTLDGITKTHPHVWDVLREFAEKRRAAAQG